MSSDSLTGLGIGYFSKGKKESAPPSRESSRERELRCRDDEMKRDEKLLEHQESMMRRRTAPEPAVTSADTPAVRIEAAHQDSFILYMGPTIFANLKFSFLSLFVSFLLFIVCLVFVIYFMCKSPYSYSPL